MTSHICKRCNYKTKQFNDMLRHINKKKTCPRNIDSIELSEDQMIIFSLMPYNNEKNIICQTDIEHLSNSNFLYDNLEELTKILYDTYKNKSKICLYCKEEFVKFIDLRKHILTNCFINELHKKENDKKSANNVSVANNNMSTNDSYNTNCNNTNNTNVTNNITNINIEFKTPVPFDDDWDISQINQEKKTTCLVSSIMYTELLKEILKNDTNLNVIIDKKSDSGMVYKNDIDKYIQMKIQDIIDNTMEKLKKHLLNINKEELKTKTIPEIIDYTRKIITKKHIDYEKNNNGIKKTVTNYISDIYHSKKDDAIKISSKIKQMEQKEIIVLKNEGF